MGIQGFDITDLRVVEVELSRKVFPDWTLLGSKFEFIKNQPNGAVTKDELPDRGWPLERIGSVLDSIVWV